jgi:RNA polymerase sigma factor (sigma-70 family)
LQVPSPASGESSLSSDSRRMLDAIEKLPDEEREAFELVRLQDMSQAEAARIIGVSAMTIKRRLNRSLQLLSEILRDMQPETLDANVHEEE